MDTGLKRFSNTEVNNGVRLNRDIWDEFPHSPMLFVYNGEKLIASITGRSIKDIAEIDDDNLPKGCSYRDTLRKKIGFSFSEKLF